MGSLSGPEFLLLRRADRDGAARGSLLPLRLSHHPHQRPLLRLRLPLPGLERQPRGARHRRGPFRQRAVKPVQNQFQRSRDPAEGDQGRGR